MLAQSGCRPLFVAFSASVAMLSWPEAAFAQAVPHAAAVADKFALVHNSLLQHTPTVSLGATYAVAHTYECDDGRIAPTRCAVIDAALGNESAKLWGDASVTLGLKKRVLTR